MTEVQSENRLSHAAPRFQLREIAGLLAADVLGDPDRWVTGLSDLRDASDGDLVFAESARYLDLALASRAGAVLTSPGLIEGVSTSRSILVVPEPRRAFVRALELFAARELLPEGIDPTARIHPSVQIGAGVRIGAYVTVGADTRLGDGVVLMSGVRIAEMCEVGDGTMIYPNAILYARVTVGRACVLHAGCVLGADGFGFIPVGHELRKVPHLGGVEIGDGVEIGANSCIDRGKTGLTVVGAGTKIDNLVHVAHNVRIGRCCLLVAQVGIAGSVEIGDGVVLGGQAGIADHLRIGSGARVGAQGGVIGDVAAGETVSGYPARPHRTKMREYGAAAALPAALKRLRALEARLERLEAERDAKS